LYVAGHPMANLFTVSLLPDGGGSPDRVLHIGVQAKGDGSGQAKWRLTGNQVYHLTFEATQSNPRDDDSNPLDLAGPLTFHFRTASLPEIDFFSSTIGNQPISSVTATTGTPNRYQLPGGTLTNASTVLDMKLKFSQAVNQ